VSNKFSIAFELALDIIHKTNSVPWKGPLKAKPIAKAYHFKTRKQTLACIIHELQHASNSSTLSIKEEHVEIQES